MLESLNPQVNRPQVNYDQVSFDSDINLLSVAGRFASGVLHGFTTINIDRSQPENTIEGLAQSLGTWVGISGMFIGGPVSLATKFLARGGAHSMRLASTMSKMNNVKSVPIWLGEQAIKGVKKANTAFGTQAGKQFIQNNRLYMDSLEGSLKIGTAMGSLGWQEGIDSMLSGAALGAFFGGADRFIGNAVRGYRPEIQRLAKAGGVNAQKAEKAVSMISAGIVSGMPSTLMGQPWEYQVYDYLFGAWLGAEPSYVMRRAHKFVDDVRVKGEEIQLMSPTSRDSYKPYKELLNAHPHKRVKEGIAEEIEAQVNFRFGQMMGTYTRAAEILSVASARAEMDPEALKQTLNEIADGSVVNDSYNENYQRNLLAGMPDSAAQEFAMMKAREDYVKWKQGDLKPSDMNFTKQDIQPWKEHGEGLSYLDKVMVNHVFGVVTKVNKYGRATEVTASDGAKLVVPSRRGGRITTADELASQRESLRNKPTSITRGQFIEMIAAESYADTSSSTIPKKLWDLYPDIREAHTRVEAIVEPATGKYRPIIKYNERTQELPHTYDTAEMARQKGIEFATTGRDVLYDRSNPHIFSIAENLKALGEHLDEINLHSAPKPLIDIARDISMAQAKALNPTNALDIALAPIKTYKRIYDMAVITMGKDPAKEGILRDLDKAYKRKDKGEIKRLNDELKTIETKSYEREGWNGFKQKVTEYFPEYKWNDAGDNELSLRNWYRNFEKSEPVRAITLNITNARVQPAIYQGVYPNGQLATEYKAPSMLHREARAITVSADNPDGLPIYHISKTYDESTKVVADILDTNIELNIREINDDLLAMKNELGGEYFVMSGQKDKDTLRVVPYAYATKGEAMKFFGPRYNALAKDPVFKKDFQKLINEARAQGNEDLFIRQYATTMRLWEQINGNVTGKYQYPIEFLANTPGFINTVANLNKRLQIMDADGLTADPTFYKDAEGNQMTNFKSIVFRAQNNDGTSQAEGVAEYTFTQLIDGVYKQVAAEEYRDGPVIVNQRTFDMMARDAGADVKGGALKGVTAFSDRHGAMLGKYAMFRASDHAQAWMDSQGLDLIYYDTTTKQLGNRKKYNMTVGKDKRVTIKDDKGKPVKNVLTYDVPIEGVTFNVGSSENIKSAMKPQKIGIQLLQSLSPHLINQRVAEQTVNDIIQESLGSTPEAHHLMAQVEAVAMVRMDPLAYDEAMANLREQVKKIDVNDIGVRELYNIYKGDDIYVQTGLYDKVIREIHNASKSRTDEMTREDIMDEGINELSHLYQTDLDIILSAIGNTPITPELLNAQGLRQYVEGIHRNYLTSRTYTPRVKYSLKSIGSQQDGWFQQSNGTLPKGEFMLGQGAREMTVRYGDNDIKLGELYDQYKLIPKRLELLEAKPKKSQAVKDSIEMIKAEKLAMEEAMMMVVARVPIEHASGVRPLKFVGFSSDPGVTSKLNAEDMANLGGMDLDIDSVFIYQNMGKKKFDDGNGNMRSMIDELMKPEVRDHWYNQDGTFRSPKNAEMMEVWQAQYDKSKSFANMFAPSKIIEGGRASAGANKSIGMFVNARRDLLAMAEKIPVDYIPIESISKKILNKIPAKELKGKTHIEFRLKPGAAQRIDEIARAGINMSADAADLTGFIKAKDIGTKMYLEAYEYAGTTKLKPEEIKRIVSKSVVLKSLRSANQLRQGKFNRRRWDPMEERWNIESVKVNAMEMISQLRQESQSLYEHTLTMMGEGLNYGDFNGSFYRSTNELMNIDMAFRPLKDFDFVKMDRIYTAYNEIMASKVDHISAMVASLTGQRRSVSFKGIKKAIDEYNNNVARYERGELEAIQITQSYDKLLGMVGKDAAEMTSAIMIYREGARLEMELKGKNLSNGQPYDLNTLVTIFQKVSELKGNYLALTNQKSANRRGNEYDKNVGRYKTFEALQGALQDYRGGLPKELKRFFDIAGIANFQYKFIEGVYPINSPFLREASTKTIKDFMLFQSSLRRMNMPKGEANQRKAMRSIIGENVSDDSYIPLENPELAITYPKMDLRYSEAIKNTSKKARKQPISEKTTTDTPKSMVRSGELPEYGNWRSIRNRILDSTKDLNIKDLSKFDAEEQLIIADLEKMFRKYPQLHSYFDQVFIGEQAYSLRRLARAPEIATKEDVVEFLGLIKGAKHGFLLDDARQKPMSKIESWMYWWMPDRYHSKYAGQDMLFDPVVAPTITRTGTTDVQAKVISSTPDVLRKLANTTQLGVGTAIATVNERISEEMVPLQKSFTEDFDTIFQYTVFSREVKSKTHSSWTAQQEKVFFEKMTALRDKKYVIDGQEYSAFKASEVVSKKLTALNEYIWNTIVIGDSKGYAYYDDNQLVLNTDAAMDRMFDSMIKEDPANVKLPGVKLMNHIIIQGKAEQLWYKELAEKGIQPPPRKSQLWIEGMKEVMNRYRGALNSIKSKDFETYFPHTNFSNKAKQMIAEREFENRKMMDNMRQLGYYQMRVNDMGEASAFTDDAINMYHDLLGIKGDQEYSMILDTMGTNKNNPNVLRRNYKDEQLPEWDARINSYLSYTDQMVTSQYNKALAIVGSREIYNMETRMPEQYRHYGDFLRLYLSDQVMTSTMVPEAWVTAYPELNIKGSKYFYMTDRYYTELDKKISKILETDPLLKDNDPRRPWRLAELSNMEAKYSLITLLSRPKSAFMNIYGGGAALAADTGITSIRKGWNLKNIQRFFPEFTSWKEAMIYAENHGAMETLVRSEVMDTQAWGMKQNRRGLEMMLKKIKEDPSVSDQTLMEISKKYGISDNVMNIAAFPMRYSERLLRTRSFWVHYMKAVDTLEANGMSAKDHPWALAMARRGVATTQYMYNNANRPAFARSNVGKIFARFKMWSMNSVKYRLDAFEEFRVSSSMDSQQAKRMNDIMMLDMFMVALGALFPFTVFGNSIPEPYGWMTDLVSWAFGDEKEKERSFRSGGGLGTTLAPLSVTLPPSSRLLTGWIEPTLSGEWDNFTGYTLWSLFPFGLLARDTSNFFTQPHRGIESVTGLPVEEIQRNIATGLRE